MGGIHARNAQSSGYRGRGDVRQQRLNFLGEALRIQPIREAGWVPGEHSGPHGVTVIGSHRPALALCAGAVPADSAASQICPPDKVCMLYNPSWPGLFSLNRLPSRIYRRIHPNAPMSRLPDDGPLRCESRHTILSLATGLLKSGACSILFDCSSPLCSGVGGS